ncbi:BA75_04669T0 [Komagataella pastoris]|uniref:BA75_04669T0 n=1 Tax=Komagataella pastoris TaxID=4922 RepID=A0A1B2JIZ7_PICPA|nr:BA75_04669T0 [Komagataella pastoris]
MARRYNISLSPPSASASQNEEEPSSNSQNHNRTGKKSKKRKHHTETSEEAEPESTERITTSPVFPSVTSDEVEKMAISLVRASISYEKQYQVLNNTILKKLYTMMETNAAKVSFDSVFHRAVSILTDVFGLELAQLPEKSTNKHKKQKGDNTAEDRERKKTLNSSYILVNSLPVDIRQKLARFYQQEVAKINSLEEVVDSSSLLPTTGTDLIHQGFNVVVLSVIVINSNRVTSDELHQFLSTTFKISCKENIRYEFLGNRSVPEFCGYLEKQEYIARRVLGDDKESKKDSDLFEYFLGRRARAEISKDAFYFMIQEVFGEMFTEDIKKQAIHSINTAYSESG